MTNDQNDRFGIPLSVLVEARKKHSNVIRAGLYVPTRAEVATWPPEQLHDVLTDWLWESPSELIPTDQQVAEVLAILEARPDASELAQTIAACKEYMEGPEQRPEGAD